MGRFEHLKVRQVDSGLERFREIQDVFPPDAGWARAGAQGQRLSRVIRFQSFFTSAAFRR